MKVLEQIDALFADRKLDQAMGRLFELIESGRDQETLMDWLIQRAGQEHPQIGAHLALAGGALVEGGAPAGAIGRAIVAPVVRALTNAKRMFAYAKQYGHEHAHSDEESDDHEHEHDHDHEGEHDHDHDHDHDHALEIGGFALSDEDIRVIAKEDVAAVQSWFSLDMWYRPAVACWTRDLAVLREVQSNQELRAAIKAIGRETQTSYWLSILIEALGEEPVFVLVPELGEVWSMTAKGVVDLGQLTVLASHALENPLQRVKYSGPATEAEHDVMAGDSEQSGEGGYSSNFAFYPIEATDPEDGLPRDGIHMWEAPGGTGDHSLPGDFLPGTLPLVDGARLLVMVGPTAPGLRFVRIIQSSRMFDALPAAITNVKKLPDEQAKRLLDLAKQRGAAVRA